MARKGPSGLSSMSSKEEQPGRVVPGSASENAECSIINI